MVCNPLVSVSNWKQRNNRLQQSDAILNRLFFFFSIYLHFFIGQQFRVHFNVVYTHEFSVQVILSFQQICFELKILTRCRSLWWNTFQWNNDFFFFVARLLTLPNCDTLLLEFCLCSGCWPLFSLYFNWRVKRDSVYAQTPFFGWPTNRMSEWIVTALFSSVSYFHALNVSYFLLCSIFFRKNFFESSLNFDSCWIVVFFFFFLLKMNDAKNW